MINTLLGLFGGSIYSIVIKLLDRQISSFWDKIIILLNTLILIFTSGYKISDYFIFEIMKQVQGSYLFMLMIFFYGIPLFMISWIISKKNKINPKIANFCFAIFIYNIVSTLFPTFSVAAYFVQYELIAIIIHISLLVLTILPLAFWIN